MKKIIKLSALLPGEDARVTALFCEGALRRRLSDLGIIRGESIACIGTAPLGDPHSFLIRGKTIAIRRIDADKIEVSVVR